ncbi:MAG: hypothetical protein SGI91_01200 [Alphaproteobacteria bacterium]|nr:hypothetical protein [Alphaproteobacteria bacterium]
MADSKRTPAHTRDDLETLIACRLEQAEALASLAGMSAAEGLPSLQVLHRSLSGIEALLEDARAAFTNYAEVSSEKKAAANGRRTDV